MFAQVVVNVPAVRGVFDYSVPADIQALPGCLVMVPFGAQTVQGIILRLSDTASVAQVRPISALLDTEPVLTPLQLELAQRMAEETLSSLAACVELMLPPGVPSYKNQYPPPVFMVGLLKSNVWSSNAILTFDM